MFDQIVTGVGIAIAKSVFKTWVKDKELVSRIGDSLLDLLGTTIQDTRTRSAAARQFSRIADRVAETLEPIVEHEFRAVDHAGRSAALLAAASAIESVSINAKLVASLNSSDIDLSRVIMMNVVLTDLNNSEMQLVPRLVQESASLIIDLSSSLPAYTVQTFAEILRREQVIMDKIDNVVQEIETIRAQSRVIDQGAAASRFEAMFRHSIARNLEEIELYGLDLPDIAARRQNLTTAYISLTVVPRVVRSAPKDLNSQKIDLPTSNTAEPVRAEQAVAHSERILIRGEAGSGKTTLLQFLAVKCATASFSASLVE